MASTPEFVAQHSTAISAALAKVTHASALFQEVAVKNAGVTGTEASGTVSAAKNALVLSSLNLLSTIRGPLDSVFCHFENAAHSGAVRALLEMGVFQAIPTDGSPIKAQVLAEKLNVEHTLLVRLMRNATLLGPFKEVGPQEYAHTPYSMIYLVPEIAGITKLMIDEYGSAMLQLGMFFKENGFKTPISQTNNPYTFAMHTNGESMWDYMSHFPERASAFNSAMQAQTQATAWTVNIFPFATELSKVDTTPETVLLVDIGGGKGHATEQIRSVTTTIPGRIILQDLSSVLSDITAELPGVERMVYDFFTPQPIIGAEIYYIRRCLHDWPEKECIDILTRISEAMRKNSRCLISEIVVPEENADIESQWMDVTMMTLTGMERTLGDWKELLGKSGLEFVRTWNVKGTNYSVVEAKKKGAVVEGAN